MLDPRDTATLSLLGHDLRATLSEVMGGLRLLDGAGLDPVQQHHAARTRAAGEALSLLLEQALLILLGDPDPADPATTLLQTERLLDGIRLRWESRAREGGLTFVLDAPDLPPQLRIDGALIERVLSNLLGNAIKFSDRGCVTCRITLTPDRRLLISVVDDGPGFAENALPRLFMVNSRPENASRPGSGLGLHIVRDMVDRAGGSIMARNRPEGGAEVAVHLPVTDAPDANAPPLIGSAIPDLGRCRVLVADDAASSRLTLAQALYQMGAEVVSVVDGVEAVGRLERESFDLALIDIEMPRMTGLDLIRHLRGLQGRLADLPVIAITAHSTETKRAEILAAGAQVVLTKPLIGAAALAPAIIKAMGRYHSQTAPDQNIPSQIDPAAFDRLLVMAGPATAAELLDRLLADLRNTQTALITARTGPDLAEIRAQTHVLIALAGTAGGHRLHGLATALNAAAHDSASPTLLDSLLAETLHATVALIDFVARKSAGGPP